MNTNYIWLYSLHFERVKEINCRSFQLKSA